VAAPNGRAPARVALFEALAEAPWKFDFFQALRRIENLFADRPKLGKALRPADEPVRLSQEASVAFAPSTLSACDMSDGKPPRLEQRFFGLLGANGPLPLHITEYARERLIHNGDATLVRFLDLFHHRMGLLFYRAWAEARPTVHQDRPDEDRFTVYVGSLAGHGLPATRNRGASSDISRGIRRTPKAWRRSWKASFGSRRTWISSCSGGSSCRVISGLFWAARLA